MALAPKFNSEKHLSSRFVAGTGTKALVLARSRKYPSVPVPATNRDERGTLPFNFSSPPIPLSFCHLAKDWSTRNRTPTGCQIYSRRPPPRCSPPAAILLATRRPPLAARHVIHAFYIIIFYTLYYHMGMLYALLYQCFACFR